MKILAFDTTLSACSIALMVDGTIIGNAEEHERARQVERLFPMIEALLAEASLSYADLDALAVTTGPGSFTGVRIGIAAAKGLRLVTGLPVIALSGLEVIARALSHDFPKNRLPYLIILDAYRHQVFAQSFASDMTPLMEPALLDYAAITDYAQEKSYLVAGNGSHLAAEYLPSCEIAGSGYHVPTASLLARDADELIALRPNGDDVAPLYIRAPDAKLPANS